MARERFAPNDILANRQRTKDRATCLGKMDHPDNAKVRSEVGSMVDVRWVMEVVNAIGVYWDRDPDRCTYPTDLIPIPQRRRRKPTTSVQRKLQRQRWVVITHILGGSCTVDQEGLT